MTPRKLVCVRFKGRLGNQLFQYAVGAVLASRLGGNLRVDMRRYKSREDVLLRAFGIELDEWTPLWWKVEAFISRVTRGRWRPGPERLVEANEFEPRFFTIEAPCYLKGYFQSWRYFEGDEDFVRKLFDTARLSTPRIAALEQEIREAPCPVMVHVRRGDYGGDIFTLLGRDHYDRARACLEATGMKPTYFLFSDDIDQASTLLADWPDIVPVRGNSTLEDLRLMSLCRHHIIANSTFSWWGAWLANAADKIVIAPNQWFGPGFERECLLDERLPPAWIRV